MKKVRIELPDRLAAEVAELVAEGWFTSEAEVARRALADYLRRRPFEVQERFLREDIAWALGRTGGEETPADPSGERERFVETVEEGLADAEAGRVISDEELGRLLDEEFGPLDTGGLKKRLRKDRPMTTVSLRIPEDVVRDLERIAPRLGFSGYVPLLRAYVGQGLRRDLAPAAEQPQTPGPAGLDTLDHRLLQALVRLATGPEGQEEVDRLLRRYLDEEISLSKLAERLGVSRFELQESFDRLGVPVRLGPATLEDARDEVKVARDLK
jgi:predicted transcriptional regulator/AraC-like DNA-binding protein